MDKLFYHLVVFAADTRVTANDLGIREVRADDGALANIMSVVYFWAGLIAVISIIVGGFLYVISAGEPAKVTRAKNTILYSVVGLFVVIFAFFITQFILGRF